MQRSISGLLGACGLIFTFTAAAQTAGGGGATAGGSAGAGSSGAAQVGTSGGARVGTTGTAAGTTANSGRTTASGTAVSGQNVSTLPGQNVSITPPTAGAAGQPGPTAPVGSGTTITAPNSAGTTTIPGATPGTPGATLGTTAGTANTTTASGVTTTTRASVAFNSLPAAVQAQIAAQIPAGAQVGGIIAETNPQGVTTYRAQVMQNGIISEVALNGSGFAPGTTTALNGLAGTTATTTGAGTSFGTGGFIVGTPYAFEQLPAGVQTAFAAQGVAAGATNITWTPGAAGSGVFHAMVDGRPVDIRVAGNGQVLQARDNRALASSNTTTNALTLDDLPVAVRDAIRNSAPFAQITRISKTTTASGDVYDVTMRANDRLTMMQIAETGTVIKENHDLAAAVTTDRSVFRTNELPKLAWNSLPTAVRDAIEVQTPPDTIRGLALTNHLGKTAYVVDYVDKDAIRNRLFLNKEGLVVDTQTNLFGIAMTGKPVVIDDLPAPARTAVQQQAENSAVTRIDLAMYGLTPVYVVTYQRGGEARQMVISRDGKRMDSNVGAPAVTTIGSEKGTSEADSKATELNK